jgi:hypothetical protein
MDLDMAGYTRMRSASLGWVRDTKQFNSKPIINDTLYITRPAGAGTDRETSALTEGRPPRPAHPPSARPAVSPSWRCGLAESGCWRGPGETRQCGVARRGSWPSAFCAVQPCACPARWVTPSPRHPSRIAQTGRDPSAFDGADFGSRGRLVSKRKRAV